MERKETRRQFAFWLMGAAIGIAFAYLTGGQNAGLKQYMGLQNLMNIMYHRIDYRNYLGYLLRSRGVIVLGLMLSAMTIMGRGILSAFVMFVGISMGTSAAFLVMQYKAGGVLLFLAMLLPQVVCYIPAGSAYIRLLGFWNERMFREKNRLKMPAANPVRPRLAVKMLGVTIIGILLECYVNPAFVKFVIKIL